MTSGSKLTVSTDEARAILAAALRVLQAAIAARYPAAEPQHLALTEALRAEREGKSHADE